MSLLLGGWTRKFAVNLGLVAQATDPAAAVMISIVAGFVAMGVWIKRYPQVSLLR